MEKLNELVALAEKADAVANLIDGVNPHTILAIAEAFRTLLQRAEAAEAQVAAEISNHCKHAAILISERGVLRERAEAAEAKLASNIIYQVRLLDGGENSLEWVEVTEEEFNTPTTEKYGKWEHRKLYTSPAPATDLAEMCDRQYIAGLQAGFRLGDAGDNEGLSKATANYRKQIIDNRNATTPAAGLPEYLPDDYFGDLVSKARSSAEKAMVKFPQPNYVLLKVAEEAGEVVQAGVHYAEGRMKWEQLEGEVIQLLAMLIRLVTEGDQVNGVTPPESCRDFKPAPAADLAKLVPDVEENEQAFNAGVNALVDCLEDCGDAEQGLRLALRASRAAILRNIEEAK